MKTADISVEYIQHTGSDLMVANAARVSFDKESSWDVVETYGEDERERNAEFVNVLSQKDTNLIKYLAKHKHFSPFNHSFITLRIKAPIFVARQLVKHKFMPINEVSRRYVDSEPEFYFPEYWRKKAENVKQGSSDERFEGYIVHEFGKDVPQEFQWGVDQGVEMLESHLANTVTLYKAMIHAGIAAEQARMILPQNMLTSWWWSGTLGAYCDMLKLRLDPHTQKESRIVAEKVKAIIEPLFPVSVPALLEAK